jgi:hypothetical protein
MNVPMLNTTFENLKILDLFENTPDKWLTACAVIALTVCSACLTVGTIWYDLFGTDSYKTLIHLMSTQMSWTGEDFTPIIK